MTVRTLPLAVDFTVYTNTTFVRQYRWLPDGQSAQNFTEWTAVMLIGPHHGQAVLALTSGEDGGIALDAAGLITLTLTPEQTAALAPGNAFHVVDLSDPDGAVIRFLRGRFLVVHDLDPPAEEEVP